MTPGQAALAEAARLEASRVYGTVSREHKQPVDSDVDKVERAVRKRLASVENRNDTPSSPSKRYPQDELVRMAIEAAISAGMSNHAILAAFGVDYSQVRAARKRLMREVA